MEGDLIPFGKSTASDHGAAGYEAGRDRGANACVNRMGTFPWDPALVGEESEALKEQQAKEVDETQAAYKLAAERVNATP